MIFVLLAVLWKHRPHWHRTPVFASSRPVEVPPVHRFTAPGDDPLLSELAAAGGDLTAHRTVHLEDL